MGRVEGKVALITGAASGLGCADAEVLAREGATVVLTDVNVDAGEAAAESIRGAGGNATFVALDVANEEQWQQVIEGMRSEHSRLDVLVNNAGLVIMGGPEECSLEAFRKQNTVMSEGVFLGCKHALPLMHESGGGSIINIVSIAGLRPQYQGLLYSFTKAGLIMMTQSWAQEFGEHNIRVNAIAPGLIKTDFSAFFHENPGRVKSIERTQPIPRIGDTDELGYAALYLASDASSFTTGEIMVIDGGAMVAKGGTV